jgi:hypothetical protein
VPQAQAAHKARADLDRFRALAEHDIISRQPGMSVKVTVHTR